MDEKITAYRERQDELVRDSRTILAAADGKGEDPTAEERERIQANSVEFEQLEELIATRESVLAQEGVLDRPQGRVTEPDDMPETADDDAPEAPIRPQAKARPAASSQRKTQARPISRERLRGDFGFEHFGEFVAAVRSATVTRGVSVDPRLQAASLSTSANESSGADGGYAVPPDFRATIMEKAFGEDSLISRTDRQVVSGNTLTFPADMTTPWGSDGIQAYWTGEQGAITQSKPELEEVSLRLHKLAALVPVTEEMLDDATAMGSYVARKAAEKIDFKLSDAIAWGTGAGQPLGFMNSPSLVTQTAESSQVADTIVAGNVVKMLSRLPVQSRRNAVWLIHPDAEPQLPLMTLGDKPIYLPPGGFRDSPFGNLLGRPVIPHQVCKTVGDLGDIVLADLSQYLTAVKSGGLRSQTSIHLWFDQDVTAFKFTVRVAGQPWWSEATTAKNGSFSQSPFVALAART